MASYHEMTRETNIPSPHRQQVKQRRAVPNLDVTLSHHHAEPVMLPHMPQGGPHPKAGATSNEKCAKGLPRLLVSPPAAGGSHCLHSRVMLRSVPSIPETSSGMQSMPMASPCPGGNLSPVRSLHHEQRRERGDPLGDFNRHGPQLLDLPLELSLGEIDSRRLLHDRDELVILP